MNRFDYSTRTTKPGPRANSLEPGQSYGYPTGSEITITVTS